MFGLMVLPPRRCTTNLSFNTPWPSIAGRACPWETVVQSGKEEGEGRLAKGAGERVRWVADRLKDLKDRNEVLSAAP